MERRTRWAGWKVRACRQPDAGMVLVAAMLAMAMLSLLALAAIATTTLEVKISAHDRDAKQAFYLCEAGLEQARYETIKAWGTGTGAGTTFTFASGTMPAVLTTSGGDLEWGPVDDKWEDFTLCDRTGVRHGITSNTAASYQVTCATSPADGRASVAFIAGAADVVSLAQTGIPGANQMQVTGATWGADVWTGYLLADAVAPPAGPNRYRITGNTADTLSLTPLGTAPATPATSNFTILRAGAGADLGLAGNLFRLYQTNPDTGAGDPGAPNAVWRAGGYSFETWYLIDAAGTMHQVTATAYGTTINGADYMDLTLNPVTGNPVTGPFQIVTNPWLKEAEGSSPSYSYTGPSGTNYGNVALSVTESATTPGRFTLAATSASTATGDTKEIRVDVEIREDGWVTAQNWRQER